MEEGRTEQAGSAGKWIRGACRRVRAEGACGRACMHVRQTRGRTDVVAFILPMSANDATIGGSDLLPIIWHGLRACCMKAERGTPED